jgi:hypothetical protein
MAHQKWHLQVSAHPLSTNERQKHIRTRPDKASIPKPRDQGRNFTIARDYYHVPESEVSNSISEKASSRAGQMRYALR